MLAQRRHRSHDGVDAVHLYRRQQGADAARRRIDRAPAVALDELRMFEEPGDGIAPGPRHIGRLEPLDEHRSRNRGDDLRD